MRFRASIAQVQTFFRIIQAIEKQDKKCIIKFTETSMHIICNPNATEGVQVWSQVKIDSIFTNYRIQSNADNQITVLLASEALLGALKSAASSSANSSTFDSDDVVVKLAKKSDQAVLTFEISGQTRVGHKMRVSHDVKIEVMRPADVEKLKEPLCPEPDVHILLPPLQKLRTIVERLRPLSDILAFQANNNKRMVLAINTESVRVETEWKDCTNPRTNDDENENDPDREAQDPEALHSVLLSTRSFLKFLNSHVVSTTTIACVCQHHCLILYVYIGDVADAGGVLTFYIPAIIDDEGR
ncbi:checkpoint protein Hus1/Mec3 [Crepidotus variabilis]|uniref:Checkpoint protein n=1 Tax=Crepidotus variabilis TaxID=179855 RepID=A0A9P6JJC0_9AGAR|nr:checkpoint protein Hus1/Mec3 [Crepidotus variabilis]